MLQETFPYVYIYKRITSENFPTVTKTENLEVYNAPYTTLKYKLNNLLLNYSLLKGAHYRLEAEKKSDGLILRLHLFLRHNYKLQ